MYITRQLNYVRTPRKQYLFTLHTADHKVAGYVVGYRDYFSPLFRGKGIFVVVDLD